MRFGYSSGSSSSGDEAPFQLKPIQSRRNKQSRQSRRASSEASSSTSSSASDDEVELAEELDSEEEIWPVGPVNSIGVGGWRREQSNWKGKGRARDQEVRRLENIGKADIWDDWEDKSKATSWSTANRSFHLSLSRSFSHSPSIGTTSAELQSIQSLLSNLAIETAAAATALQESFETRNTALWSSIENSIKIAEKEESDRVLEESRLKGLEKEKLAKEMREAEAKKVKLESEKKKLEVEAAEKLKAKLEAEKAKIATPTSTAVKEVTGENSPRAEWQKWTDKMTYIKTSILPFISQNPALRKTCFNAKRAITPKIGQLTNSAEAINTIINQLDAVLNSAKPTPDGTNAEAYIWVLNHLSKALVRQAETEATVNIGTAYPMGRVVVGLLVRGHAELGEVLMARLVKKCFWITGSWPAKIAGQTPEERSKTLGHAPPSSEETLLQYATRMSGILALYFAILQTSPHELPQSSPSTLASLIPTHFQPSAAWKWFHFILQPPFISLEPTPLLLVTVLEIAGENLMEVYGKQFGKILDVLLREGIREGKAGFSQKSRSTLVRLELWLEDWEKSKVVEGVKGRKCDP